MSTNYYAILGIPVDASPEEIKSAYREMARKVHPDSNKTNPQAGEMFLQVKKAYDVLSKPELRSAYDDRLPLELKLLPASLQTLYSRTTLAPVDVPQLIYALVKISPPNLDTGRKKPPLNVCLAVDCSTSMQGVLLDTVKSTSIELVRQLQKDDIFSVVSFSDRADVIVPASILQDRQRAEMSIRLLQTAGGTELYQGLQAAYLEVKRNASPKYVNHIVLITDGRTYGDEAASLVLAEQASRENIGISCLGIGGKWNDEFLDKLSVISGGITFFVAKPKDVHTFLQDRIHHLENLYANRLRLEFQTSADVEIKEIFRTQPDAAPLERKSPIILGALPQNENLELIIEFLIPPFSAISDKISLIKGRIFFDLPASETTASMRFDLSRPISTQTDNLPPPQIIVQAMSNLTLYRIQERARKAVDEGKINEATRMLQNLATHLFSQGKSEFATSVLHEASHLQRTSEFSEIGDKRIKYGTRALLLLPSKLEKPL